MPKKCFHLIPAIYLYTCNTFYLKARQEHILESRRIMEEQDREYQESLQIDQEKEDKRQRLTRKQKEQVNNSR